MNFFYRPGTADFGQYVEALDVTIVNSEAPEPPVGFLPLEVVPFTESGTVDIPGAGVEKVFVPTIDLSDRTTQLQVSGLLGAIAGAILK